ncbi:hypothetical protein MferCBS31731_006710 [Microsporum ferrugineum]
MTSSTIVSFASPVRRVGNLPPWFRPSQDGRSRSSRGSSDDSEELPPDGWTDEDLRAGGPHLAPSPSITLRIPYPNPYWSMMDAQSELSMNIESILESFNVHIHAFTLCYRQCIHFPDDDPVPTLFVDADRRSPDDQWLSASRELRELLEANGLSMFNVEICDGRVNSTKYSSPVPSSDPIYPLWGDILNQMLHEIDLTHILTIDCLRFGESINGATNPTTVILTIDRVSAYYSWKATRETIISILGEYNLHHTGVIIAQGRFYRGTDSIDQHLPEIAWQSHLQVGLSLGIYQSTHSSLTFGGWLEIQEREGSDWIKLGLTCFHCVIPDIKSLSPKDQTDVYNSFSTGVSGNDPICRKLRVEQPSLKDSTSEINELSARLNETPDIVFTTIKEIIEQDGDVSPRSRWRYNWITDRNAAWRTAISKIKNFHKSDVPCNDLLSSALPINPRFEIILKTDQVLFSPSYAGHVYAASGYRQFFSSNNQKRQADWALLDVPKARQSSNTVMTYGETGLYADTIPLQPFPGIPNEDTRLFKLGRSTRKTRGFFSGLESAHIHTSDGQGGISEIITLEHAVTGASGTLFSDPGDSGALVFDSVANCIGLIFAGNTFSRASYITLLPDLFDDIKTITGAVDVRIAE